MSGRRDQVLAGAVRVLASRGARALTHRAVDAAAGVPAGTASNHFRTRSALVDGVLEHVATEELRLLAWTDPAGPRTVESAAGQLAASMVALTGPHRELSLARYAIFQDALGRPELHAGLAEQTARFVTLTTTVCAALGATDPGHTARLLLACVNGMVHDQLLRPVDPYDPEPDLRRLITGLTA